MSHGKFKTRAYDRTIGIQLMGGRCAVRRSELRRSGRNCNIRLTSKDLRQTTVYPELTDH